MYSCDLIELEDFNFNHMVHHYDDEVREIIEISLENGSIDVHAEYMGAVLWDEV